MQEENHGWLPYLTNGVLGRRCVGLDPMTIPVEVLIAAGHPPRRTRALVSAFMGHNPHHPQRGKNPFEKGGAE
jgi:hypothetical protein